MSDVSVSRACGEGIGDPIAAVARTHSLCRWALVIVVFTSQVPAGRGLGSETDGLRVEGVIVEM